MTHETQTNARLVMAQAVARMVKDECATDAHTVNRTPFPPRGIGETFGRTLALIAGLARAVEVLAAEVGALQQAEARKAAT